MKLKQYISSIREISSNYKNFIFDCDGVIWKENVYLTKAVEAVNYLKSENKNTYFLSNTNTKSRLDLQNKIEKAGIRNVGIENVYTSSYLISKYIKENYGERIKNVYMIGNDGVKKELEAAGINVYGGSVHDNETLTIESAGDLKVRDELDAVVCAFDHKINYYKLTYATQVILKTGLFFGTNYDQHVRIKDNLAPGTYTFIAALETSSDIKAIVIAKPDPYPIKEICSKHGIDLKDNNTIMIGDNLKTDILFAKNAGIDSILVFTGVTNFDTYHKYSDKELEKLPEPNYLLKELII